MKKDRLVMTGMDIGKKQIRVGNKIYVQQDIKYGRDGHIKKMIFHGRL